MMVILIPVMFMIIGFMFAVMARIMPILNMIYFPEFGMIFIAGGIIFLIYRMKVSDTIKYVDKLPKGKHLISYLRRDNEVCPIYGKRAYPGESFIDVEGLGLMEFLGKDCFYHWGDKNTIWGLENINFSPDPRYFNLTHLLWELGFTDSMDVYNVLNGIDLELMARIYLRMNDYDKTHGANRLITELKEYDGKTINFKPKFNPVKHERKTVIATENSFNIHDKIDSLLGKR